MVEDGNLRVGGRLSNYALSVANKHPIVLSAKHALSALLASSYHLTLVQQSTADLPVSRVSPTRPFSLYGVDYCGPFYVKSAVRNRGPTKVYVAIFVCFSTKAVHIELSLKAEAAERQQIFDWCAENEITWKFIPPRAPHFEGLWEAAVKSAKNHLLKVVGNVNFAYEDLLTLLAQVDMCLNARPLTPIP
ncbi:uncharacterized protein LOC135706998 [Ochlerotatus camptorhynchus]|uniref:uncharacterized protein LOC135706998 n=1 Tax=Ochlerotatus camptorhynchus TaxID=644619 RepID=UPI0031D58C8E